MSSTSLATFIGVASVALSTGLAGNAAPAGSQSGRPDATTALAAAPTTTAPKAKDPAASSAAGEEHRLRQINTLFNRGLTLLRESRAFEARAPLEKARNLAPDSAAIRCNLGLAYQNSGNLNKALTEFQEALRLRPGMPEATLNIAGCYQCMGQLPQAISWYRRFLDENPAAAESNQVSDLIKLLSTSGGSLTDAALPDYYAAVTKEGRFAWDRKSMPLKLYVSTGNDVPGFRPEFEDIFFEAMDDWIKAAEGKLSYVKVRNRKDADIVCDWTADPREVAAEGTQAERGIARIFADSGTIERASVKILTRPLLSSSKLSNDDLKKACLHEIGHALGLQGHSANNHDVMFFTVDTPTVWPVLSKRDKNTIKRLYAQEM